MQTPSLTRHMPLGINAVAFERPSRVGGDVCSLRLSFDEDHVMFVFGGVRLSPSSGATI